MLLHHLRHAFRMIVREPAFSTAAILTLALGVGANVAVFAVVESLGRTREIAVRVALALASIGAYAVMSSAVRQRSREIGTRMALGATEHDILWSVMRQGLATTALGVAVGLVAAVALGQSLNAVLYDVKVTDPATLLVATGALALSVLAACYVPARRAARVDPARTLTAE